MLLAPIGMGAGATATRSAKGVAATVVKVGTFTTNTSTGAQVVTHDLGEVPKGAIFWAIGRSATGFGGGSAYPAIGVSDGTTNLSVANGHEPTNHYRGIRNSALHLLTGTGTQWLEFSVTSWTSTTMTINLNIADGAAGRLINYQLIGGGAVSAKVLSWTTPTSTGNKVVTGVGFSSDLVFHVTPTDDVAIPFSHSWGVMGFGVMDKNGNQWATSWQAEHTTTNTHRGQRADACVLRNDGTGYPIKGAYSAMGADGFTVNFSAVSGSVLPVVSLCITGLANVKVGTFTKEVTGVNGADQTVTGVGFTPKGLLFSHTRATAANAAVANRISWGMSATSGVGQQASAADHVDNGTTASNCYQSAKLLSKVRDYTSTLEAEADLLSFNADGFTLDWATADTEATVLPFVAIS